MTGSFESKVAVYGPRLMKDFGLADFMAGGVFGNVGHESLGMSILQEIKPTVPGSAGGYGWCQWTGPRRRAYEAWCVANRLDKASDEANYGFLCVELRGTEKAAIIAVKKTTRLADATDAFCRAFERPGVVALASRIGWSTRALAAIRSATAAKPGVPPPPVPARVASTVPATPTPPAQPAPSGLFSWLHAAISRKPA